jgi:PAS domain S-box-containing protein
LKPSLQLDGIGVKDLQILWEDGERVLCRGQRVGEAGARTLVVVMAADERLTPSGLPLKHEFELRQDLNALWAARPLDLNREGGRTALLLEDPGGEPLAGRLGAPMELGDFLRLAIGVAAALGMAHRSGLVHKDVKPANILVDCPDGLTRFTGFGVASRLPRQRQAPVPPEVIAGTLAYMAPEQTGRMNRSIDSRSDLYSLGVTFYEMLTGRLPFHADDPMEWVHCHIAKTPTPPAERVDGIPEPVSEIVMKLLAKPPEARYQTATGVEHDLKRCLRQWRGRGRVDPFALGDRDTPDRLMIREKLYGREREVLILLSAFDRVVNGGAPELVLVSGYSGIGKSSVVHELHKALVPPRGLFASGKFDQLNRDIPYSTLVQAFRSLMRPLLSRSDAELAPWRAALAEALAPNARLLTDLIPELKLIIGEQPPIPELEPQQAQSRFQLAFRRFIEVVARAEHPLALFLDDLQWLDAATLDLIEVLLTGSDLRHLMLIGAYRDNEVDAGHPLMRKLAGVRIRGARVSEIKLQPLDHEHVRQLIGDAIRRPPDDVSALAGLAHEKTVGNPFFILQFLYALEDERLLVFDHVSRQWTWDLEGIWAKDYSDNVADLMIAKLTRLPDKTREVLEQLACLGAMADFATLAIVLATSEDDVHAAFWPAVLLELIERLPGAYKFVHDRVREAAYSLIPDDRRAAAHLLMGRLLIAQTPPEKREEAIFEIVNQLNRGAELIDSQEERELLAELNLVAARRAKNSTAYASALTYLDVGMAASEALAQRRRGLAFELELIRAECEFLTGALEEANHRLAALFARAADDVARARIACLRMDLHITRGESARAITVGLDYLRRLDVDWSAHPTEEEVRREYERIWSRLGGRSIEDLVDLPLMSDPASLATLDVLIKLAPPAFHTDANLIALVSCRAVNISIERQGNSDASCAAYVYAGMIAGQRFGDYQAGYRFGRLGYDLVERRGLTRFQARTYMDFGNVILPWTKHVRVGRDLVHRAFEAANKTGDLTYAAYARDMMISNILAAGDPLDEAQLEAEHGLAFARKAGFGLVSDIIATQYALIRTLRGQTPRLGSLDHDGFDEAAMERHFSASSDLAFAECWYWVRKMQARFLAGDFAAAVDASSRARPLLWTSASHLEMAEYHFYGALSQAACCDSAGPNDQGAHVEALAALHSQLQKWAENCPENFECRAALVGAEIARIQGREIEAQRQYELAIRSSRANRFAHVEALAYELAAHFYTASGFEEFGRFYLKKARNGYLRWGADGKARQLEDTNPQVMEEESVPGPTSTTFTPVGRLDLATVIRVSQAVSAEIVLERLLDTLMRTAIEQAGAERGLLILDSGAEQRVAVEATTSGETVIVTESGEPVNSAIAPDSVLRFVIRTHESVILDEATAENPFSADLYIRQQQPLSLLCLPLINQAKLIGVLYLENKLASHVFAPGRVAVLKLLASQAAISLENSRLYHDVEQREAKIRRLVDANIIGIFIWELEGRILEANDAFLGMVGYDREDLASGRLRWTDLTPPEWLERDLQRRIPEHKRNGRLQPYEKEYFRKDGGRVPVLIGVVTFEEGGSQGVAFVLDLSERKRAEEELRTGEARFRTFVDHATDAFFLHGPDGTILDLNRYAYESLGYGRDELIGAAFSAVDPYANAAVIERIRQRFATEEIVTFESRHRRKDGTLFPVEVRVREFRQNGQSLALSLARDITERKRAEEALQRRDDAIRVLGDSNIIGIFVWEFPDTRIIEANDAFLRMVGLDREDLAKRRITFLDLTPPEGKSRALRNVAQLARGGTMQPYEKEYFRKDGSRVPVIVVGTVFDESDTGAKRGVSFAFDLTERKRTEEALREMRMQLEHANRVATMGQLTASIAHEVNQPIAASVTNAQAALRWMNRPEPDLEEARRCLGRVVRDAARAGEVVGRIRDLIKRAPPRKDLVEINSAIREVIEVTRSEALKNAVSVQTELADDLPFIHGDRVELQQVLLNLIINAVEAMTDMSEGPRDVLLMTKKTEADEVLISVRDSGPGLAPAIRDSLFKAFQTTKPNGLGLGLSICRSIIETHGGCLWASANATRGTVFHFTLPSQSDAAPVE